MAEFGREIARRLGRIGLAVGEVFQRVPRTAGRNLKEASDRQSDAASAGARALEQEQSELAVSLPHSGPRDSGGPDLSQVTPIDELLRVRPGDADNERLTAQLSGLGQRYGAFRLGEISARYEFPDMPGPSDRYQFPHRSTDNRITIIMSGTIFDDARGVDVGYIRRDFYLDEQGRPIVHNENIYLDDDARGQGFGKVFTSSVEDYYRRSGVYAMYHMAGGENGGRTWALADHRFDNQPLYPGDNPPTLLADSVDNINARITDVRSTATPADQQLLDEVTARFNGSPDNYPTPNEIVRLTGDDPNLGDNIMRGSSWWAMKLF